MSLKRSLKTSSKHRVKNVSLKSVDETQEALDKLDVATFTNLLVMSHSPQSVDSDSSADISPFNDLLHLMGYTDYSDFTNSIASIEGTEDLGYDVLKEIEKEIEEDLKEEFKESRSCDLDFNENLDNTLLFSSLELPGDKMTCFYCGVVVCSADIKEDGLSTCDNCSRNLITSPPIENGHPILNKTGHCNSCNEFIRGASIYALGATWCPDHFICTHCKCVLLDFKEHEGKPYCKKDFSKLFGSSCKRCEAPVHKNHISALGETWHLRCFSCVQCDLIKNEPPDNNLVSSCHLLNGQLLCEQHYYHQVRSICPICNDPVKGPCLNTRDGLLKFHLFHFACITCQGPLHHLTQPKNSNSSMQCSSCCFR